MASFLQVDSLTKSYGDRLLFGNITFGIAEGDKVGLIAKNGTGKSTLLKIIAGLEDYDSGEVIFRNDLRVGYLEQIPEFPNANTVIDTCLDGNDNISVAVKNYEEALLNNNTQALTNAIQQMDNYRAWDYEDRFKQILSQLKITDYHQPIAQLSGGQLKRLALAKLILSEPQLIILDEPTNHLDIEMIEWLENFLSRSKMAILMVTHDRYFLDKVCSRIIEIDDEQIYTYEGNYNYYLEKRAERLDAQASEQAKARNLYRTELDWMRRQPQARASKAKYRIDAFYKLEKVAKRSVNNAQLQLDIKSAYIGSKIFVAHHVGKSFDNKVIVNNFDYEFARYEKLGIVGGNGVGKSTFIKLLLGHIAPDSGRFDIGETVRFGYYSQEGIAFNDDKRVIDCIKEIAEHISLDEKTSYSASQFLSLFLFSPSDQQKLIGKLSGGERRRLYLATVLAQKPNFLVLDEPTNDLDIITLGVLEDYIARFKGCVIVISHDRYFMDRTVDHIFIFEGDGVIKDFPGNYSEYREWKELDNKRIAEETRAKQASAQASAPLRPQKRDNSNRMSFKERKEFEALTQELEALNAEKDRLETLFNSGETITDIESKSKRYTELKDILDEKEMRWLELSEKE